MSLSPTPAAQDHDGSHIKGLVINFLHHFWPSLLRLPGFLREFITPIVKVRGQKTQNIIVHADAAIQQYFSCTMYTISDAFDCCSFRVTLRYFTLAFRL